MKRANVKLQKFYVTSGERKILRDLMAMKSKYEIRLTNMKSNFEEYNSCWYNCGGAISMEKYCQNVNITSEVEPV